ncbi:MAG: hypothetical protein MZV65_54440 [Chromatiales bacterium]|nr:hypothetical protein [Chromatiales bacterium]
MPDEGVALLLESATVPLNPTPRRAITLGAYLITFHVLLAYGLPGGAFVLLALAAAVLYWRIGVYGAVSVAFSALVVTFAYSLMLHITGIETSIYYRPDEMLSEFHSDKQHRAYRPNTIMHMRMPYGDLQPMTSEAIGVPRDVEYRIDSYGFRNDADYAGERYLLVGDSFIAGSSNTQSDLLSSHLRRDHAIPAYNLAHPGGMSDYASYVSAFARAHTGFRVVLFVFEGNDFEPPKDTSETSGHRLWRRYYELFSDTNVYRVTKSLTKRATRRSKITGSAYVTVRELRAHKLAFLTRYVEATETGAQSASAPFESALVQMRPYLEHVFFIPTNYRIYRDHLTRATGPLPDAKWQYLSMLCRRERIACTNLTGPMQRAADQLLARDQLLWWPDDTHWNGNGVAVAARVVAQSLGHGDRPSRRQ